MENRDGYEGKIRIFHFQIHGEVKEVLHVQIAD